VDINANAHLSSDPGPMQSVTTMAVDKKGSLAVEGILNRNYTNTQNSFIGPQQI
jgi:hypothetical protein